MNLDNMDDFGIYDDLDEFHEKEEKKSKELLALENKYEEALKTIEAMNMEKKDLRKKIRLMEQNLQSLLDTAKAEIKRKDKIIDDLRKEKDDICFRRQRLPQTSKHNNEQWHSPQAPTSTRISANVVSKKFEKCSKSEQSAFKRVPITENLNKTKEEEEVKIIDMDNVMSRGDKKNKMNEKKDKLTEQSIGRNPQKSNTSSRKNATNNKQDTNSSPSAASNERKYGARHNDLHKDKAEPYSWRRKDESREPYTSSKYENRKSSSCEKDNKERIDRHRYDEHSPHRKHKNEHRDRKGRNKDDKSHNNERGRKESEKRNKSPQLHKKEDDSSSHKRRHDPYTNDDRERKRSRSSKESIDDRLYDGKRFDNERRLLSKTDLRNSKSPKFENIESSDEDLKFEETKTVADKVLIFPECGELQNLQENEKNSSGINCALKPEKIETAKEIKSTETTEIPENRRETIQSINFMECFSQENATAPLTDNCKTVNAVEKLLYTEEPENFCGRENQLTEQKKNNEEPQYLCTKVVTRDKISLHPKEIDNDNKVMVLKGSKYISAEIVERNEKQILHKEVESACGEVIGTTENGLQQKETETETETEKKPKAELLKSCKETVYGNEKQFRSHNIDQVYEKNFQKSEKEINVEDIDDFGKEVVKIAVNMHKKELDNFYEKSTQNAENEMYPKASDNAWKNIDHSSEKKSYKCVQNGDEESLHGTENGLDPKHVSIDCGNIVKAVPKELQVKDIENRKEVEINNTEIYRKEIKFISENNALVIENNANVNCKKPIKDLEKNINFKETNNFDEKLYSKEENGINEDIVQISAESLNTPCVNPKNEQESLQTSVETKNKIVLETLISSNKTLSFGELTSENNDSLRTRSSINEARPKGSVQVIDMVDKNIKSVGQTIVKKSETETEKTRYFSSENISISNLEKDFNSVSNKYVDLTYSNNASSIVNIMMSNEEVCDIPKLDVIRLKNKKIRSIEFDTSKVEGNNLKIVIEETQENFNKEIKEIESIKMPESNSNCINDGKEVIVLRSGTINASKDTTSELIFQIDEDDEIGHELSELTEHELQSVRLVYASEDELTSSLPNAVSGLNDNKDMYIENAKNIEKTLSNQTGTEVLKLVENSLESKIQSNEDQEIINENPKIPLKQAKDSLPQTESVTDIYHENKSLQLPSEKLDLKYDEFEQPIKAPIVNPGTINEKNSMLNSNTAATSSLENFNNENDKLCVNLSLSSDEDEKTLAELQKICKIKQKEKIEILENVCLPTLFTPIIHSMRTGKNSPKKRDVPKAAIEILKKESENLNLELPFVAKGRNLTQKQQQPILEPKNFECLAKNILDIAESKDGVSDKNDVKVDTSSCDPDKNSNEADINTQSTKIATQRIFVEKDDREKKKIHILEKTHFKELGCFVDKKSMKGVPLESFGETINKSTDKNEENDKNPLFNSSTKTSHNADVLKPIKHKSPIKRAKNFTKLKVTECSKDIETGSSSDDNGEKREDYDSNKNQLESSTETLMENMKKSLKSCNTMLLPEAMSKKPRLRNLTKELRPKNSRRIKTHSFKSNEIIFPKYSPCKSDISNLKINSTKKLTIKRKRSSNLTFTAKSSNAADDTMCRTKSMKLSTSAEVRAMLIDGKSPKITNDILASSALNVVQDTNLDELDKDMQAIFHSPAKCEFDIPSNDSMPCGSSTMLDTTINESIVTSSNVSENLSKTQDSSFESKRLSLGTTQYVYERVSENVVNLFITRRRNKKRNKLDTTAKQINVEKG